MFGFFKKRPMTEDEEDELIYKTQIEGRGTRVEHLRAEEILRRRAEERLRRDSPELFQDN